MKRKPTSGLPAVLATALLLGQALPAWPAGPVADPLARAALASPLAQRSVLTAITRNGPRLIAVGERGHILLSDDEGRTWRQAQVPVSVTLTAVSFVDERNGWACGHGSVILHSEDGGLTWTKQLDGHQAAGILRAAAGAGGSAAARPAGLGDDQADKPLLDIHFEDAQHGFALGAYGLVLVTGDGGRSWAPGFDRVPNPDGKHLYALHRVGPSLVIVGEQGSLFLSRDEGRSFTALATPYKGSFFDLVALDATSFLIVGLRGSVYRTEDDGKRWTQVAVPTKDAVVAGTTLADGTVVLVDGAGNLWRSSDRGMSFAGGRIANPFPLSGVAQASATALAVVGARGVEILPMAAPGPAHKAGQS